MDDPHLLDEGRFSGLAAAEEKNSVFLLSSLPVILKVYKDEHKVDRNFSQPQIEHKICFVQLN